MRGRGPEGKGQAAGHILLAADGDRGGRVGGADGLADGVSDLLHLRPRNTVWCMRATTRVQ